MGASVEFLDWDRLPKPGEFTRLSPSAIETWNSCQTMFFWEYLQSIQGAKKESAPAFGTAFQEGLDAWFEKRDAEAAVAAFTAVWTDQPEDDKRTVAVGSRALREYGKRYRDDGMRSITSRVRFELPVGKSGFVLTGEWDRVVEWIESIYVLDHKTAWQVGSEERKRTKPNWQFDAYIWAARTMHPEWNVRMAILDVIQIAKTKCELLRADTHRTDEELAEFEREVVEVGEQINEALAKRRFVKSKRLCTSFFNRLCPFHGLCEEQRALWPKIVQSGSFARRERGGGNGVGDQGSQAANVVAPAA